VGAKVLIASWRAIAANDIDFGVGTTDGLSGVGENVEKPWIEVVHLSGAMVAEKMVELRQCLRNIALAAAVNDIQVFAGMRMVEPQVTYGYCWRPAGNGSARENRNQDQKTDAHNVYLWTPISRRQGRTFPLD